MITKEKLLTSITNLTWNSLAYKMLSHGIKDYVDLIGVNYTFDPINDHVMTTNSSLFEPYKALAMWLWYKKGDRRDKSICDVFEEYKHCIDKEHKAFNSNYGYYAFACGGLDLCIDRLIENSSTRQAMFCINHNYAMSKGSIDKLCTNTIHFMICGYSGDLAPTLEMIVQMRSSNFLTLLPYDAFMFTMFYGYVFRALAKHYSELILGKIRMQVASLHLYEEDIMNIKPATKIPNRLIGDFVNDNNWMLQTEKNLLNSIRK